ncbi:MAG: hypothetical protein CO143_01465 [Candidatus Moranbacteria bacterium CG_4_9_14_3_um_filter_45_14]|nr:MAG: hypothetical protein AUK19_02775 [Candidatus Moranbacteria bacterium CG2_30_45_14]PJA85500.1 MAG: hypothetical protein CO143_01465 [Candidatus Moranbacteria bacterium CG_4_9_14_3_um_filter_45_14]
MSMFEKIILFFLFFLPFQFALHPTEGIDLALIRVLAIGIFLLWGTRGLLRKKIIVPEPRTLFFFSAYLLWAMASILWAGNANWAFRKVVFLLSFFPLFLVFFATLRQPAFREKALKVLAGGAILSALFALIQFLSQFIFGVERVFAFWVREVLPFFLGPTFSATVAEYPSLLVNISGNTVMRAISFFPDPHMFSFFLGMSLPLVIALSLKNESGKRYVWAIGAVIVFLADIFTFSRGGYGGLIFGMGAFFVPIFLQSSQWRKRMFRIGTVIMVLSGVMLLSPVGTRLLSSFSQSDTSNIERLRLWQEATVFVLNNPIFGTGLGNYPLFIKPSADYREPIYAHNLYLDIASESGLVGLFFFCGFLFFGVLSAWKRWRSEHDVLWLASFSSLIIFSVHAFFETPLFSVHILPFLLFLIALSAV